MNPSHRLGQWRSYLTTDGGTPFAFSADDLSKGVNLADYETPMRKQSQKVGWLVRDRDEAHFIHMRMLIRKADAGQREGKGDLMDAFEDSLEDAIYDTALPQPHTFSLSSVHGPS